MLKAFLKEIRNFSPYFLANTDLTPFVRNKGECNFPFSSPVGPGAYTNPSCGTYITLT